ncbi:MAG: hypothetical protein RQ833_00250 [Sphingomonadaceae bacterium]|nr:hypothetical protein [Sphingomonadaceae bacterium]
MADTDETGFSDASYALVSVLYHTLQGIEVAEAYVEDAEDADDEELAAFLREVMAEDRRRAARAKALLLRRLREGDDGAGGIDSDGT